MGTDMFKEHQRIVLTHDIAGEGLRSGDVGTIVHVHKQGKAFEVEFLTLDGQTATVAASQVRAVSGRDITHARRMEMVK
jgi:hypothetical protein